MKRSSGNAVAAGLPAWPKFRSRRLRRILAAYALALATTAQAPTASAQSRYSGPFFVCEPQDHACEEAREAKHQKFVEGCKVDRGSLEGIWCVMHRPSGTPDE
ncbi:hypothetical protein BMJ34_00165 [Sinorhizobium medicae]|uniref:Uncharacterized protein n=1 Tax=Sinorhizobium medicae TaxID=110321 RepID=A0ABX4TSU3_9HYPH|nr:hypothetical protein BMJ34_00165 [Sinorhizobium medicae]PLU09360.1 hypothetical protein BMJ33_01195 [Sinorhizobium medicae]PLU10638.1 hypothetical protein BMJ30_32405 [Sinorhizobium medicae]PLU15286.1 hypothetical protein BMJ29_26105 [Sinorhizobium medicae]PLU37206.1 hypothetical protein BMJ27_08555 [Sinorhizobium medicae]